MAPCELAAGIRLNLTERALKENVGWAKVDKPRCPSHLEHSLEHHAHVKVLLGRLLI